MAVEAHEKVPSSESITQALSQIRTAIEERLPKEEYHHLTQSHLQENLAYNQAITEVKQVLKEIL